MKLLVWGINYAPETVGIGPFNTALCDYLASQGHTVEMLTTFSYYPAWKKIPAEAHSIYRQEQLGQVTVHRCWHYVPRQVREWKRILHELSFVLHSSLQLLFRCQPEALIVVSPPLLLGLAAWICGKIKNAPYAFHVQDLQPDAAVGLGLLKPSLFTWVLYWLEKKAYLHAAFVTGISPAMVQAFRAKGVSAEKTACFPNGVELENVTSTPTRGTFRRRLGLSSSAFLAIYSGNIGNKQGLGRLILAAEKLSHPNIIIIIAGDGAARAELERKIELAALPNLRLLPLQSEKDYHDMLADADVCLITQESGTGHYFLPSKLLKILAQARPVVAVADAESPLVVAIEEGKFGWWTPPEEPAQLAALLEKLAGENFAAELSRVAQAGRDYVAQFAFDQVFSEYWRLLHQRISKLENG